MVSKSRWSSGYGSFLIIPTMVHKPTSFNWNRGAGVGNAGAHTGLGTNPVAFCCQEEACFTVTWALDQSLLTWKEWDLRSVAGLRRQWRRQEASCQELMTRLQGCPAQVTRVKAPGSAGAPGSDSALWLRTGHSLGNWKLQAARNRILGHHAWPLLSILEDGPMPLFQ